MNLYHILLATVILPSVLVILVSDSANATRLPPADTADAQVEQGTSNSDEEGEDVVDRVKDVMVGQEEPSGGSRRHATRLQEANYFKELIYNALQELASEGRIDERVVLPSAADHANTGSRDKRGRYQGFCFQKTASGRYLPYICWKGDRK